MCSYALTPSTVLLLHILYCTNVLYKALFSTKLLYYCSYYIFEDSICALCCSQCSVM